MSRKRQKMQLELPFMAESRGETPKPGNKGSELLTAKCETESPTEDEQLMERICQRENLLKALANVKKNKGSSGVDRMPVSKLTDHLKKHWDEIKEQLLSGIYKPKPVKRVEIPKSNGGVRKLGIPTVLDRFIQQAILQVLQEECDATFSDASYGFRPGRSAHQAVNRAQEYITQGYKYVVDMDIEKFFDHVNHDILMSRVARRVKDKRVLKLIRAFLNAGVMENGLLSPTDSGTPQGGPLSPLLSNLLLDELDKELEKRRHKFVRYADDCNIYVRSERAGLRVMESIRKFLLKKLRLKVNEKKSAVDKPSNRKFLGFSFTDEENPRRKISPESLKRFKDKVKKLTRRKRNVKLAVIIRELSIYLRGWIGYYGHSELPYVFRDLDGWIRRRLRAFLWKQWKTWRKRLSELTKRGVYGDLAIQTAMSSKGAWRISHSQGMSYALRNAWFKSIGLFSLADSRTV